MECLRKNSMKFGYARVSKNDQSLDIQIQKLQAAGCDEIFKEKTSGVTQEKKELKALIHKLRAGDTICVLRLDRLGRRMLQLVNLINDFKDKQINFVALENNIDTTTPLGMVLFSMCAAFAEMERELLKERVKAGIEAAHANGRKGGRPRALTDEKKKRLASLRKTGTFSVTTMCQMVGITRSVYYRSIKID